MKILNADVGQWTSDLNSVCTGEVEIKKPQRSVFCPVLFCATNSGSSQTPLELRGGTSFELADSCNCIELTFLQYKMLIDQVHFIDGRGICQERIESSPIGVIALFLAFWSNED